MTRTNALVVPEDLLSLLVDLAREQSKPAVGFKRSIDGGDRFSSMIQLLNEKYETEVDSAEFDKLIDGLVLTNT